MLKRAKNGRVPLPSCSQCIETPADHSGSVTKNCAPMKPWSTWNLAATVCDDVLGAYILFLTRIGLSLRNHCIFWDSECALGRIYFDSGSSERSTDEMFTSRRGERRWPMPRLTIIQTVIFWPVKAKTISMPTSRNSLHLGRWESSSYF